jgi:2-keto-4-pentenoate hydratase/2-oxohepta-3-ene-1,7-dioic acid hydratase in catechol pathway
MKERAMKIAKFAGTDGRARWGAIDRDSSIKPFRDDFVTWARQVTDGKIAEINYTNETIALDATKLLAPVETGGRVFGLGMNYTTHLTRLGHKEPPPHPVAFLKTDSAVVDPYGEIRYPAMTKQLDYEVELVAVVGRALVDEDEDPTACLLGYTVGNDVSARDAGKQLEKKSDFFSHKSCDQTAPIGPWIVTIDEIGRGQPELDIKLRVNGEERQNDNTRNMVFPMEELLNFVDIRIRLRPGDVLFTGTSFGVGLEDGRLLQPGDMVETEVTAIGVLRNRVGAKEVPSANRLKGRIGMPL